jgi:hypothetical protein
VSIMMRRMGAISFGGERRRLLKIDEPNSFMVGAYVPRACAVRNCAFHLCCSIPRPELPLDLAWRKHCFMEDI